jgi:hypothetical protein
MLIVFAGALVSKASPLDFVSVDDVDTKGLHCPFGKVPLPKPTL